MAPKIGVKSYNLLRDRNSFLKEFDVLEITTRDPSLAFHSSVLKDLRERLSDKELSVHSPTGRTFAKREEGTEEFREAEVYVLKAEIIFARLINAREVIFHLKEGFLDEYENRKLKELIKFAESRGIDFIYESNKFFSAETALKVLNDFPELNYNLDLGHLNTSIESGNLGISLDEFIEKIKNRVVYIHAHNNYGLKDEHLSLKKGTLNWKYILNRLDLSRIKKIIIEAYSPEDIFETKKLLKEYFKEK